jgi:hypothetical protein
MVGRRIIRGLGIALLTLCVAAWVGSYFGFSYVRYVSNTRCWWSSLDGGGLDLIYEYHGTDGPRGWLAEYGPYPATWLSAKQQRHDSIAYHLLGFAWQPRTGPDGWQYMLIPLWFPTTLAAGFLWLAWRKTRPKYNGKGFPVEVDAKPTKA